jgi:hypothetical protein
MTSATMTRDGNVMRVDERSDRFARLLQRIRGEFLEMPGMRLTLPQAQRLWGVDAGTCEAAVRHLLETKFLTVDGARSLHLTEGAVISFPPVRMAKAGLQGKG